jgi:hypothetical protein
MDQIATSPLQVFGNLDVVFKVGGHRGKERTLGVVKSRKPLEFWIVESYRAVDWKA